MNSTVRAMPMGRSRHEGTPIDKRLQLTTGHAHGDISLLQHVTQHTPSKSYRTHPHQLCPNHATVISFNQTSYSTCSTCSQLTTWHPMDEKVEYGSCPLERFSTLNEITDHCPWVEGRHGLGPSRCSTGHAQGWIASHGGHGHKDVK